MSRGRQAGSLRNRFRLYLATLIMVIPAVTSSIAHAAVNYCMPLMKADPAEGSTVTIAKRLALANWLRRAATRHRIHSMGHLLESRACLPSKWPRNRRVSGRGPALCSAPGSARQFHPVATGHLTDSQKSRKPGRGRFDRCAACTRSPWGGVWAAGS